MKTIVKRNRQVIPKLSSGGFPAIIGGAASGAASGAFLGPPGAIGGALLFGGLAAFNHSEEMAAQKREEDRQQQLKNSAYQNALSGYSTTGHHSATNFAKGGTPKLQTGGTPELDKLLKKLREQVPSDTIKSQQTGGAKQLAKPGSSEKVYGIVDGEPQTLKSFATEGYYGKSGSRSLKDKVGIGMTRMPRTVSKTIQAPFGAALNILTGDYKNVTQPFANIIPTKEHLDAVSINPQSHFAGDMGEFVLSTAPIRPAKWVGQGLGRFGKAAWKKTLGKTIKVDKVPGIKFDKAFEMYKPPVKPKGKSDGFTFNFGSKKYKVGLKGTNKTSSKPQGINYNTSARTIDESKLLPQVASPGRVVDGKYIPRKLHTKTISGKPRESVIEVTPNPENASKLHNYIRNLAKGGTTGMMGSGILATDANEIPITNNISRIKAKNSKQKGTDKIDASLGGQSVKLDNNEIAGSMSDGTPTVLSHDLGDVDKFNNLVKRGHNPQKVFDILGVRAIKRQMGEGSTNKLQGGGTVGMKPKSFHPPLYSNLYKQGFLPQSNILQSRPIDPNNHLIPSEVLDNGILPRTNTIDSRGMVVNPNDKPTMHPLYQQHTQSRAAQGVDVYPGSIRTDVAARMDDAAFRQSAAKPINEGVGYDNVGFTKVKYPGNTEGARGAAQYWEMRHTKQTIADREAELAAREAQPATSSGFFDEYVQRIHDEAGIDVNPEYAQKWKDGTWSDANFKAYEQGLQAKANAPAKPTTPGIATPAKSFTPYGRQRNDLPDWVQEHHTALATGTESTAKVEPQSSNRMGLDFYGGVTPQMILGEEDLMQGIYGTGTRPTADTWSKDDTAKAVKYVEDKYGDQLITKDGKFGRNYWHTVMNNKTASAPAAIASTSAPVFGVDSTVDVKATPATPTHSIYPGDATKKGLAGMDPNTALAIGSIAGNLGAAISASATKVPKPVLMQLPNKDTRVNQAEFENEKQYVKQNVANANRVSSQYTGSYSKQMNNLGSIQASAAKELGNITSRQIGDRRQIRNENIAKDQMVATHNNNLINKNLSDIHQLQGDKREMWTNLLNSSVKTAGAAVENKAKAAYEIEELKAIAEMYGVKDISGAESAAALRKLIFSQLRASMGTPLTAKTEG